MRIYTRTGDKGETSLFGGKRVPKDNLRIETYGTVDELNAAIGVVRSTKPHGSIDAILHRIQNDLFVLGADLATPSRKTPRKSNTPRIEPRHLDYVEKEIDKLEAHLQPLRQFLLPGGTPAAAHLHLARAVCRRAERLAVRLARSETINPAILIYLNRLSDLLFVLSRFSNKKSRARETKWEQGRRGRART